MDEKRTIHNWAARLSMEDEPLTLQEAQAFAMVSASDRLVECRTALQDMQMRLTRLELYIAAHFHDYTATTRAALKNGTED